MPSTDIPPLLQPHDSLEVNQEAFGKGSPMSSLESKDGSERDMLRTPPSDTTVSDYQPGEAATLQSSGQSYHMLQKLLEIFSENVIAKTLRVAAEALENNVRSYQSGVCMHFLTSFLRIHQLYIRNLCNKMGKIKENIFCETQTSGRVVSFQVFYTCCESAQSSIHMYFRTTATKRTSYLFRPTCYGRN
jgi:hypothetical protein